MELNDLLWGVPQRPGHDDQDDPKAHAGLTQHAFNLGNDERAICGFEPPKRASTPSAKPRPQLAIPSQRLNPRCPKCVRLIGASQQTVAPTQLAAVAARVPEAPTLLRRIKEATPELTPEPMPEPEGLPAEAESSPALTPEPVPELPAQRTLPPPPPPTPAPARSRNDPIAPTLWRTESWEGTTTFAAGQSTSMVRPPTQQGLGVVASVVSGPSGTRVKSVHVNADGLAVITLSEAAGGPVTVAWFAVPSVDDGNDQVGDGNGQEVPPSADS